MATFASFQFLSCSPHPPPFLSLCGRVIPPSASLLAFNPAGKSGNLRMFGIRVFASSASASSSSSSSDWVSSAGDENPSSKKSVLFDLIRDIEPLDVSLIQKDASNTTIDAMKRTISGMLGLLPSDQFQVMIDALWESLSKLLISSMMTGYTLRNAEYRLSLERNLEIYEGNTYNLKNEDSKRDAETHPNEEGFTRESSSSSNESEESTWNIQGFGEMTPEARRYILTLHSRISLVKKELHEVKRKSAALQMQQFVGEEKNDLLDYLRSLQPEKVLELSEPTSAELKETIHSVVHGLLATLSPKMQSKSPDPESDLGNIVIASVDNSEEEQEDEVEAGDCINTSLHFHPLVLLPRDYLARLLFWCMLLGHYLRGLEYRLELMDLLSLPSLPETGDSGGHHSV